MKRVYKYKIVPGSIHRVPLVVVPLGAIVRHVGEQDGELFVWAEVDVLEVLTEHIYLEVFGTGHDMVEDMGVMREFLNTVQMANGLVFHIYHRIN